VPDGKGLKKPAEPGKKAPQFNPTPERTRKMAKERTFSRGPDGSLYVLSKNNPPQKLTAQEQQAVTDILKDAQKDVTDKVKASLTSVGFGVNVNVADFPDL
jgi:hypothetical protein